VGRGHSPLPRIFFDFGSQNGDLWCLLGAMFCSLAETLRGRKDTLARVYFYWRGNRPARPPRDRRHCLSVCLSNASVRCAKTDEPIVIPSAMWTRGGPGNRVLGGGTDFLTTRGISGGIIWYVRPDLPVARVWNALPSSVRSAPSLLQFRRDLKTALLQSSYSTMMSSCVTACNIYYCKCKVPL